MFPSKIILFGEYATLVGAPALALPLPSFGAQWSREANTRATASRNVLWQLFLYLENLKTQKKLICDIDFSAFSASLNNGFWVESNIPNGYGLGSSGAVAAAVYHEFCDKPSSDLAELKQILAQIEGHFHGTSSGIDPLISFVKKPLLIKNNTKIEKIEVSNDILQKFFLIDTQSTRNTQYFVNLFKNKINQNPAFAKTCENELKTETTNCIAAVLQNSPALVAEHLALLSQIQYDNFQEMIPENMQIFWKNGLNSDNFKIKLCGAGGGGFFMGFANDFEALPGDLKAVSHLIV
jgi:mevalonate kinase